MHRSNSTIVGLALLFAVAIGSSQAAFAQYLPGGYNPYLSWGAYPSMNAAAANRTIYAQKSAAQRQSLAQVQQKHSAQNQFLMSQSRGQQALAAGNTRAASEAWMRANQPRQTTVYTAPRPAAQSAPAARLPTGRPQRSQSTTTYDKVVDWPSLLKASTFRPSRVRIETIMTKAEPGGPGLSKNDYQEVVMAVNRMKGSLQRMAEGLNAAEYIGVVNYLDELTKKAKAAVTR